MFRERYGRPASDATRELERLSSRTEGLHGTVTGDVFFHALATTSPSIAIVAVQHRRRRGPPGCGKPFNTIGSWTVADLGSDGVGTVSRFSDNIESNG